MNFHLGKRIVSLALAGILAVGTLTACDNDSSKEEPTTPVTQQQSQGNQKPAKKSITEVVLVKSSLSSKIVSEICTGMRDYLTENTDIEVSIVNDYKYTYEQKEGRVHFYVGDPEGVSLIETAKTKATDENAVILTEDDKTAFYSKKDGALWVVVNQFLQNCVYDGILTVHPSYKEDILDFSGSIRENWKQPIPAYYGGELDAKLYSAGVGADPNDPLKSDMSLVRNTNSEQFLQYVSGLEELGYKKL